MPLSLHAEEMKEPTITINAESTTPQIQAEGSNLRIIGGEGMQLEIYNLAGLCVIRQRIEKNDQTFSPSLTKGIYIVKVGKVARKIVIN